MPRHVARERATYQMVKLDHDRLIALIDPLVFPEAGSPASVGDRFQRALGPFDQPDDAD